MANVIVVMCVCSICRYCMFIWLRIYVEPPQCLRSLFILFFETMSLTVWDAPVWLGWLASMSWIGLSPPSQRWEYKRTPQCPALMWVQRTQLRSSCSCSEHFANRAVPPVLLQFRDTKSNLFLLSTHEETERAGKSAKSWLRNKKATKSLWWNWILAFRSLFSHRRASGFTSSFISGFAGMNVSLLFHPTSSLSPCVGWVKLAFPSSQPTT